MVKRRGFLTLVVLPILGATLSCGIFGDEEHGPGAGAGSAAIRFTHVVSTEAAYYRESPAQGRPFDGSLYPGTKVVLLRDAGSYALVRTESGADVFVAADTLRELSR